MYKEKYYKCKVDNVVRVSSDVPENAEILETMDILTAEEGNELVRISDGESLGSSVWLRNGDSKDNYKENPFGGGENQKILTTPES